MRKAIYPYIADEAAKAHAETVAAYDAIAREYDISALVCTLVVMIFSGLSCVIQMLARSEA
jgi:hypothetical protein